MSRLEDMEMYEEENQPRRLTGKRSVRFLPISASVKEDLQEIYELQKEIGSVVFKIHRFLDGIKETADENNQNISDLKKSNDELLEQLENFEHVGERIKQKLDKLLEYAETSSDLQEKLTDNWKSIQIAINATLEANGYDPNTLMRKDMEFKKAMAAQEKRREHWSQALISAMVGILSTVVLWAYGKAVSANQAETHQAIMEVLKTYKKADTEAPAPAPRNK